MLEIGQRLRGIRDRNGLTQEIVAERMGLTPAAYQHYEKGRSLPGMADVPRLADALGVHPGELFSAAPPSSEDLEKTTDDDALLDLDAERLYRRYRRVFEEHAEELQSFMDYLDWKREQQG